jgi:hypothetical protein
MQRPPAFRAGLFEFDFGVPLPAVRSSALASNIDAQPNLERGGLPPLSSKLNARQQNDPARLASPAPNSPITPCRQQSVKPSPISP